MPSSSPPVTLRARVAALSRRPPLRIVIRTVREWLAEDGPMMAASMAYYALISIAPLTLLLVSLAGLFFTRSTVREELLGLAAEFLQPETLPAIQAVLEATATSRPGPVATAVAFLLALLGAAGVFQQLQRALNRVWGAPEPPHDGLLGVLKRRLPSFLMLLAMSVVVAAAVLANAAVALVERYLPSTAFVAPLFATVAGLAIALLLLTAMFAAVYRVLPDVDISWRDVGVGAFATAVLFTLANLAVGVYFSFSSLGTVYGTAGSLAVLLVWMYLVGQAVLLGAQFTHVWACTHGSLRDTGSGTARSCAEDR